MDVFRPPAALLLGKTYWLAISVVIAATAAAPFIDHRSIPFGHLTAYQDDFFYYLTIARNIAQGHGSTFDFIGHTNGYHPLWMGVLVVLALLTDPASVSYGILLQVVIAALLLVSAWLAPRMLHRIFPGSSRACAAGALFLVFLHGSLARTGMEVVLVVPAMLAFTIAVLDLVETPSHRRLGIATLLASVGVLARIDVVFYVVLLPAAALMLAGRERRRELLRLVVRPRGVAIVALAMLPLIAYVLHNLSQYGLPLPQSGLAKQLRRTPFVFNRRLLQVFVPLHSNLRERVYFGLIATFPLALTVAGLILAARGGPTPRLSAGARTTMLGSGLFVCLFYARTLICSEWAVAIWYLYPLVISGSAGFVALCSALPQPRWLASLASRALPGVALACALVTVLSIATRSPRSNTIHWAALRVAEFARTHPGVYAMGDRAGITGFLLPQGVVQLEGLVSDAALLDLIRSEAELSEVFRRYGVTYYVATGRRPPADKCIRVEEPKPEEAGPHARRMWGVLCQPPIAAYSDPTGLTTMIFAVGRQSDRPAATRVRDEAARPIVAPPPGG